MIAIVLGVVLTRAAMPFAARVGLLDRPGELKIHGAPVPLAGGIAVAVTVVVTPALLGHPVSGWVVAAIALALGGGLTDDVRSLSPWFRLTIQSGVGLLLVAGGLELTPLGALGAPALVVATVACCNAVNMLDGQDGLAGGLGAIAAAGLAVVLWSIGAPGTVALVLSGSCLGFLVWNRPPARVFLGDGGAYVLGTVLVALASGVSTAGWAGLLAAGACLGVIAYEVVSTVMRRARASAPAIRGDRDHTYDRIAQRLGSRTRATLAMCALGVGVATLAVGVARLPVALGGITVVAVLIVAAVMDTRLLPVPTPKETR